MSTFVPEDLITVTAQPPAEWAMSLEAVAPNITQYVAEQRTEGESWIDSLQRLLPVLAATYQQKQILDIQVERARQGLPPLDATQVAAGVNVGIAPDTQRLFMWGGAALLAVLLFSSMSRRR